MLFIVPDDFDDTPEDGAPKAQLDDGGATAKATKKVDLDLDDAPFLEDEEEEEEEVREEAAPEPLAVEQKKEKGPGLLRNKLVLIGIGVIILLLLLVAVKLLFFSGPAEPPQPPPPVAQEQAPPPPPEEVPEVEAPPDIPVTLDPFWVEQKDKDGKTRFLVVKLVLSTQDPRLAANLGRETILVRNALYYYLRNKDLQYLSDEKNTESLKKELLTVVNQYMSTGRFENLYFEEYLVK